MALAFEKELLELMEKYELDLEYGTPNKLLARYLLECLEAFATTMELRDEYFDFHSEKDA